MFRKSFAASLHHILRITLAVVILTSGYFGTSTAFACCASPWELPTMEVDIGCGTIEKKLALSFDNAIYDYGLYHAFGVCEVYTDCSCGFHDEKWTGEFMWQIPIHDSFADSWYIRWDTLNYNGPTFTTCTSGTCAGKGVTVQQNSYVFQVLTDILYCPLAGR